MSETNKAPLEDLMAAMDVVDTLRHQQGIAERELDAESRRQRLLKRLQDMYQAQGIEVPERVLLEGIAALEEERFSYTPVPPSWRTKLAHMWVGRKRWGRPIGLLAVIGSVFFGVYFTTEILPRSQLRGSMPGDIAQQLDRIKTLSKNPAVTTQSQQIAERAKVALNSDDLEQAQTELSTLQDLSERLSQAYTIRVISRPQESSGVWRIPPNGKARNYYLIVEAIDRNNKVLELSVVNEENNKTKRKKTWGLRVSEQTFHKIASDKRDDGIIQGNKVGVKKAGYLKPEFSVPTTGATITEW